MKKILITGKDSYIGTSFEKWVKQWPDKYHITTVDVRDNSWKKHDFSVYDSVLHVAAIVHVKERKKDLYYLVNRDLAIEIAEHAKTQGVSQFIFLSTMGVYGIEHGRIDNHTDVHPKTDYAMSKLQAENKLQLLKSSEFTVTILRPPLTYGYHCKGNFAKLSKISDFLPILPKFKNDRSMIYIDNLSNFIKLVIDEKYSGIYCPQNKEYVDVLKTIGLLRNLRGKKTYYLRIFNFLKVFVHFSSTFAKVFGNLTYSNEVAGSSKYIKDKYDHDYIVMNFKDSIINSEKKGEI